MDDNENKFVVVFDTLCNRMVPITDGDDKPVIFIDELCAYKEILDNMITTTEARLLDGEDPLDGGFSPDFLPEANGLLSSTSLEDVKEFLDHVGASEYVVKQREFNSKELIR